MPLPIFAAPACSVLSIAFKCTLHSQQQTTNQRQRTSGSWQSLNELIHPNLTPEKFYQAIQIESLPKAYGSLLLIASADSARRRGWHAEMTWAIEKCSNPQLVSLIQAWIERWLK